MGEAVNHAITLAYGLALLCGVYLFAWVMSPCDVTYAEVTRHDDGEETE